MNVSIKNVAFAALFAMLSGVLSTEASARVSGSIQIPDGAPAHVSQLITDAADQLFRAQCAAIEAESSMRNPSEANKLVAASSRNYAQAGKLLEEAMSELSANIILAPPGGQVAVESQNVLEAYKIAVPTTYKDSIRILSKTAERAGSMLSDLKFLGEFPADIVSLRRLYIVNSRAGEIYVAIIGLTVMK